LVLKILGMEILVPEIPGPFSISPQDSISEILGFAVTEVSEVMEVMEVVAGLVNVTAHHPADVHRDRWRKASCSGFVQFAGPAGPADSWVDSRSMRRCSMVAKRRP
jgi:hypothetical protein